VDRHGGKHYNHLSQSFKFRISGLIPSGATITGIEVVMGKTYGGAAAIQDNSVRLVDANGNLVGTDKAQIGVNWNYAGITLDTSDFLPATYGGPNDLWGIDSVSVANMITDPDFGVCLSARNVSTAQSNPAVDYMKIRIYYEGGSLITPDLSVTNSPVTYNGLPQEAAVSGSVAGDVSDIKYNGSSDIPTDAGTYEITADFTPTDSANYEGLNDASAGSFVIEKVTPELWLDNPYVVYNEYPQGTGISCDIDGQLSNVKYGRLGLLANRRRDLRRHGGLCTGRFE
jgi:hypothetical protein